MLNSKAHSYRSRVTDILYRSRVMASQAWSRSHPGEPSPYSLTSLSLSTGLSPSNLSKIFLGTQVPSATTFIMLLDVLGVHLNVDVEYYNYLNEDGSLNVNPQFLLGL